jgi:hypothetical protein
VVPVGARSGENHFWELLWQGSTAARWSLVTPPGVQDNGGLALATAPRGTLIAGFLPSINLHFSPLARSADHGATWSPQLLPHPLATSPDSLAVGDDGMTLALIPRRGGEVLRRASAGAPWTALISADALARQPLTKSCELQSIDAVSVGAHERALVGGRCQLPGQIGEYSEGHGNWRRAAPNLPVALRGDPAAVLRLTTTSAGAFTLIGLSSAHGPDLIAAWSRDGGKRWSETPLLRLGAGQHLISAGPGPGHRAYVLAGKGRRAGKLWISAGPGLAWRAPPPPPPATSALAFTGGGSVVALAVEGRTIDARQLRAGGRGWHLEQVIRVPIGQL